MATVPRATGPSQTLQPLPGVRQDIALPDAAFGGGSSAQLGQVGRDVRVASDQLDKIATRIAEQDTADQVLALDTQLGDGVVQFQQAANQRKGANAKGLQAQAKQWFDKAVGNATANVSPAVKRLFLQRVLPRRAQFLGSIGAYEVQQRDAATTDSLNANNDTLISEAVASPTADNINRTITRLSQNYRALGAQLGQTAEVVQANTASGVAKMHAQVIAALAGSNPTQARSYFEQYRGELAGTDIARLDKLTNTAVWQVQAQDMAKQVLAGKVTEQQALADVRTKYQGDQQDMFVSAIRSAGSELDSNIAKARLDNDLAIKNYIAGGGTVANMPPQLAANADSYTMAQAFAYEEALAKRGAPKTDPVLYDMLSRMTPAELFARQSSGQLLKDARNLAPNDWQRFEDKANSKRDANSTADIPTTDQLLDGAHAQLGLVGDVNAAKRGQFDMAVRDALAQASTAKKGEPLTYDEKKKVIGDVIRGGASSLWKAATPDSMTQEQQLGQWFAQWRSANKMSKNDDTAKQQWAPLEDMVTQGIRSIELAAGRPATQEERDAIWQRLNRVVQVPGKVYGTNPTVLYKLDVPAPDRAEIIALLQSRKHNPIANPTELQIREVYANSIERAQQGADQ
jgi:hypothetical protein